MMPQNIPVIHPIPRGTPRVVYVYHCTPILQLRVFALLILAPAFSLGARGGNEDLIRGLFQYIFNLLVYVASINCVFIVSYVRPKLK